MHHDYRRIIYLKLVAVFLSHDNRVGISTKELKMIPHCLENHSGGLWLR